MTDVNSLEKTGGRALPHERTAAAISVKIIRQSNYLYYNFSVMKNVIRSSKMNTTHTAMLLIFSLSTSLTFGGEIKSPDIPNENVIILKPTPGDFCLGYDIITPATINDNLILINQSKKGDGFGRYGYPSKENQPSKYLCYAGFAINYNCDSKQPNYVVYRVSDALYPPHNPFHAKRKTVQDFKPEEQLDSQCQSQLVDYHSASTVYDRGHNAPFSIMAYSTTTAKQSFILTNMTPQAKKLNQVGWAQLEKQIRTWVKQPDFGPLFVYTGPIHYQHKSRERKTIGPNKVWVPNAYFKVIYAPHKVSGQKTIAFIMPNQSVKKNKIHQYKTSIDDVEKKTGYDLFTDNMPDNWNDESESRINTEWNISGQSTK